MPRARSPRRGTRHLVKQYVFTILLTAAVTFVLSWAVWRLSLRYKLYPGIRERDVHKTPTPRLGGIAMFLGVAGGVRGVGAASLLLDRLGEPAADLRPAGGDGAHRGRRRARRRLGPRLDDQARRAVPRGRRDRVVRPAADLHAAPRRHDDLLELGELHPHRVLHRRRDERRQLRGRSRRPRRRRVPDRQRGVLRVLLHGLPRLRLEHLLHAVVPHRRGARRRLHRLPPAELESGAPVHGGCRRPHAGTADGVLGHLDHRQLRSGDGRRQRRVRPVAAARCVHPDPAAGRRRAAAPAGLRPRRRAAHEPRQVAVLARSQASAPPHARHGAHRPRRRAHLLRLDGAGEPVRAAHVHRHDAGVAGGLPPRRALRRRRHRRLPRRDLPSLAPPWRPSAAPARPEPQLDPAPAQENAR